MQKFSIYRVNLKLVMCGLKTEMLLTFRTVFQCAEFWND
jgi:hypothetical protein